MSNLFFKTEKALFQLRAGGFLLFQKPAQLIQLFFLMRISFIIQPLFIVIIQGGPNLIQSGDLNLKQAIAFFLRGDDLYLLA